MVESTAAQPPSARALLVAWANAQDHWARGAVGAILDSRRPLSEERVTHFYELFLAEKELSPLPKLAIGPLVWDEGTAEKSAALVLSALDGVEGVNALTTEQSIAFNRRMTIVFGENGAGKTGYVRILKCVADVRTAEDILPNVRGPAGNAKPRATIRYSLGGQDAEPLKWQGEKGVQPLTRLDVFDAGAVDLHVDEDLTYVYTPSDIALFRYVHDALEGVKARLDAARQGCIPKSNPFLSGFTRETPLHTKIEALGATTDINELRALASVTAEAERDLPALRQRVEALRSQTLETRAALLRKDRQTLQHATKVADTLAAFNALDYAAAREAWLTAEERHRHASETAFRNADIPGVLGEPWRAFIHAGEDYLRAIDALQYPGADDSCIYCQQPLAQAAVTFVRKLREYADGALQHELESAQRALVNLGHNLVTTDLASLRSEVEMRENQTPLDKSIIELVERAEQLRTACSAKLSVEQQAGAVAALLNPLQSRLSVETAGIYRLLGDLTAQAEERAKSFAAELAKLRLLEACIQLRDRLTDIEAHVSSVKWAERALPFVKTRIPQLQRSITEESKAASERLLNHDFETRFRAECDALKAPTVKLDFPGKKGQPARRKVLAAGHRLSEILSEGEQKALALADFLAETSLKGSSTPVVFDDPVTSLDYKRHLHVVDRLVALSQERQVIVFTHNIWFTTELLSRFEKEQERKHCAYYAVGNEGIGVISRGTHPRADTFSTMRGTMNSVLQDAAKQQGEVLQAVVERGYGILRGICEVVVETDILQGVVQRYQPNVRMTCLAQISPGAFAAAAAVISTVFERSCRIIEAHSQPLETLNVRPTLAELRVDWESVEKARKSYLDAVKNAS